MFNLHICLFSFYVALACNCVVILLYGLLQMNYEDFCHIATVCTEQIGQKCKRFFSPSNFMKFEKDDSGRIAILPFYLYVMRTVSNLHLQANVVKFSI
jgi:serine/threonine-protein phosphatase 2A regulatory subunit B''